MPTRPSNTDADLLKDAKHVVEMLDKHLPAFEAYEKPRTVKVITKKFAGDFKQDVADLERALNGQTVIRIVSTTATGDEEALRKPVYDLLVQFRKDVNATPTAGAALKAAVGVGKVFDPKSTQSLQKHAGALIEWAEDKANKPALGEAGIDAARIAVLKKANTALGAADTRQGASQRSQTSQTLSKKQLVAAVNKSIAQVRSSADAASTPKLNLVEIFKTVKPRYTPTKRAPKETDAAAAGGKKTKEK